MTEESQLHVSEGWIAVDRWWTGVPIRRIFAVLRSGEAQATVCYDEGMDRWSFAGGDLDDLPVGVTPEERAVMTEWECGYLAGLWAYAWWKDGVANVGSTGRTYAGAVDHFLREQGHRKERS